MEIWVGVVASLLGVIVGGLLQHLTAQRSLERQHKWERSRIVQEKLELIAEVAEDLGRKIKGFYAGAILAIESGERYNPDYGVFPFERIEMLINFYAPEIRPQIDQLIALSDRMGKLIGDVMVGQWPTVKPDKQRANKLLLEAAFEAASICKDIAKGASQLARNQLLLNVVTNHHTLVAPKDGRK